MRAWIGFIVVSFASLISWPLSASEPALKKSPIPGEFARQDVQKIIGKAKSAPVVVFDIEALAASGPLSAHTQTIVDSLKFAEGPAWSPKGFLVFSDIPGDTLHRWSPHTGLEVFRTPSNQANGNVFTAAGDLITCEHKTRRVSITRADGTYEILADHFHGRAFNSPNDAAIAPDGAIWFTDPTYGLQGREAETAMRAVYRIDPHTRLVQAVIEDCDQPNGIAFSPDGRRLYVADSGKPHHVRVFDVMEAAQAVANPRVFAVITPGVPDGICVHPNGDLYVAAGNGVQVFHHNGSFAALIPTPLPASNVCFGGQNGDSLFITARNQLIRLRMPRVAREAP